MKRIAAVWVIVVSLAACAGGPSGRHAAERAWREALADLRAGRPARAAAGFGQILERDPHNAAARYNLACALAHTGDLDAAFGHLEAAVRAGLSDVAALEADPDLASLRAGPRWKGLMAVARGVRAEQDRRSLRFTPASAHRRPGLLVFLHGHLDNPDNGLRSLTPAAERLGLALLVPSGGQAFRLADGSPGFGWLGSDAGRVVELIRREVERRDSDPDRIYLVGFSAGAAMAYRIGLGQPNLARGVVAMAGFLPADAVAKPPPVKIPVVILHGDSDAGAPASEGRRAAKILDAAGLPVLQRTYPGEHHFPPHFEQVLADALAWIDRNTGRD